MSAESDEDDDVDLGGLGEAWFERIAHQVGITPNPSRRDKHGWDYIAQVGARTPWAGPLDRRPGELSAFIQVKTTRRPTRRSWAVKLSNWERLVRHPMPAFFVVVLVDAENVEEAAYVIHVDEVWIAAVLKRLRELDPADVARLHEHRLNLKWSDEDRLPELHGRALLARLREVIKSPADYFRRKLECLDTVGYEERPYRGTATIRGSESEGVFQRMADFAIGARAKLDLQDVEVSEVRFGIEQPMPRPGKVVSSHMEISKDTKWPEMVLEAADSLRTDYVSLRCEVRLASLVFPFLPPAYHKMSITHPAVRFVLTPNLPADVDHVGIQCSWEANLPRYGERGSLRAYGEAASFMRLLAEPVERGVQLKFNFGDVAPLTLAASQVRGTPDEKVINQARVLECAWRVARHFGVDDAEAVEFDLLFDAAEELRWLHGASQRPQAAIEIPVGPCVLQPEVAVLVAASVPFGSRAIVGVVQLLGPVSWRDGLLRIEGQLSIAASDVVPNDRATARTKQLVGEVEQTLESRGLTAIGPLPLATVPDAENA